MDPSPTRGEPLGGVAPIPEFETGVHVLLVDDDDDNLLVLEAILTDLPVSLVKASSGKEALALLLDRDFAVILLDVQMRGLDGFETAKLIRRHPRSRNTPVIFVTGYDGDGPTADEAYTLGAVDYLTKPLSPVILRAKVSGFVELFVKTEQIKRQSEQLRQMERKLAEEALHESEQRFARFMQHLPGLAWIKDLHGRYVYANEAAAKAFAVPRSQLYGRSDDEVFPPHTAAAFRENDQRALENAAGVQVVEALRQPDGAVHYSLVSKFPVPGADGRPALVGGMAIDITERLRAEEALKEADRLKNEFLAMLAHELRNPLAPVHNALQIMKMPAVDDTVLAQARDLAERQVRHMARLLDDLLDVSRISRGRIELRREVFDLGAVVASTVQAVQSLVDERQQRLHVSLPPESMMMKGDPTRIEQVLTNLLNNAVKYTDAGGDIWLSVAGEQQQIVVTVKDSGIGIATNMLPRIFDLFVQADRRLNRSQGGLGIGLTLVRKLVELHGGTIVAQSDGPGRGSRFVVFLPAPEPVAVIERANTPESPQTLPSSRVLVVDDNVDSANSLSLLLKLQGHEVATCYDGPSALEKSESFVPQIVFLDIGMPGMDGYEVARRLRERPLLSGLRLVALTGWGQEEDRRRTTHAGFDRHFVKPVDFHVLNEALAEMQRK